MEASETAAGGQQGRFISMRTLFLVRFVILFTVMTVLLGAVFAFVIAPQIVTSTQAKVAEVLLEAGVDQPTVDSILGEFGTRYFGEVRVSVRRNILLASSIFFLFGVASIFAITTQAMRWLSDLTAASRAIARGEYKQDLSHLYNVPVRSEISVLAEAIEDSGRVHIREQVLIQRVRELEIKVDEEKKQQQVGEIVESEFFQDLAHKAKTLRNKRTAQLAASASGDSA